MYQLVIKPRAVKMIQKAYEWYEEQKNGLGEVFLQSLDGVYKKIAVHPEYYTILKKNYRQIKLPQFPYVVVFETIKQEVVVFAVFHTSRNPEYKVQ